MKKAVYDVEEIKIDGLKPTPEIQKLLEEGKCGEIT